VPILIHSRFCKRREKEREKSSRRRIPWRWTIVLFCSTPRKYGDAPPLSLLHSLILGTPTRTCTRGNAERGSSCRLFSLDLLFSFQRVFVKAPISTGCSARGRGAGRQNLAWACWFCTALTRRISDSRPRDSCCSLARIRFGAILCPDCAQCDLVRGKSLGVGCAVHVRIRKEA
jgi:hypothetical protein